MVPLVAAVRSLAAVQVWCVVVWCWGCGVWGVEAGRHRVGRLARRRVDLEREGGTERVGKRESEGKARGGWAGLDSLALFLFLTSYHFFFYFTLSLILVLIFFLLPVLHLSCFLPDCLPERHSFLSLPSFRFLLSSLLLSLSVYMPCFS